MEHLRDSPLTRYFWSAHAPRSYQKIAAPKSASFFLNGKRKATDPDDDDHE
ncbi:MAG: hypothetical protein ABSC05_17240 [Candidatus Solibacter sp.]